MSTLNLNDAVEVMFTQVKAAVDAYSVPTGQDEPVLYWANVNPLGLNGNPEIADPTKPWIYVDFQTPNAFKACISGGSSGKYRRECQLFCFVGVPINNADGRLYADQLAQMILDRFEGKDYSGIRVYDAALDDIGVRDGFFRKAVTIICQYDQHRE